MTRDQLGTCIRLQDEGLLQLELRLPLEGWHPTSYATLAEALTNGGIDAGHVVTQHIEIAAHVREPAGPKEVP